MPRPPAAPKVQPKSILWDVMDTLVVDPFRRVMPDFFGMTLEQMLREKHPTAWGQFETGELAESAFLCRFFRDERGYDHDRFKASIRASYGWIEGVESVLQDLSARGVDMHALSNYPEWYTWIEERLGVSRYVRWSFVSCHTGVRKPDPAAFLRAAEALERAPAECLFIDDRQNNCEAARAVGMTALQFVGDVAGLRRDLRLLGLLGDDGA
jgi:FMN hydrolase / 5-amino-6-(5-phospho-D-ribitylamino)uracil phosphatase